MARITTKIKATTLLEVIVSMLVILIVFTLSMAIYVKVAGSSPSVTRQQARAIANEELMLSIETREFTDRQWNRDSLQLSRKVQPYKEYANLAQLEINVWNAAGDTTRVRRLVKLDQ